MYSTAALMLANGHIGDLMADANRERRAELVRSAMPRSTGHGWAAAPSTIARCILRIMRAAPRATAR
jgi:hypothetical protein